MCGACIRIVVIGNYDTSRVVSPLLWFDSLFTLAFVDNGYNKSVVANIILQFLPGQ
jgi:hypothetical protein